MSDTITPVLRDSYVAVKAFVVGVLGIDPSLVVQGYPNEASMPPATPGWVQMTAHHKQRLATSVEDWDMVSDTDPTTVDVSQSVQVTLQLDCFSPLASDWADMLTTLLRSTVGCDALKPACQPLYADDPIRAPLTSAEAQYNDRWIVQAVLQYNPVVTSPQQFADAATVTVINVDEAYPP